MCGPSRLTCRCVRIFKFANDLHVHCTCTRHPRQPQKHSSWGGIRMTCKFGIGGALRLTCRCLRFFSQAFTRRHVPRVTCRRPTRDRHHCRSGVSARPSVPPRSRSDQLIGRYSRKCLDTHTHTHTQTDKHDPANFFSPTHLRKSSFIRTCYAKALAPSILYDFGLEAGTA